MPLNQQAAPGTATIPHQTVYVVEDHSTLRRLIIEYVNNIAGLKVIGDAATAEDALVDSRQSEADIVMTDLSLPGMSGVDLTRHLCVKNEDRRIIVLSAHNDSYTVQRAFHAGASAYVTKENPDLIEAVVKQVLTGKKGIIA